jgi:hypothetical protein
VRVLNTPLARLLTAVMDEDLTSAGLGRAARGDRTVAAASS